MARNAAFREVRAQAIKRRLDEGEALGSRAAAGRGTAEGEGIRDNVHDGWMAGSFAMAGLEAVAAAGTGGRVQARLVAGSLYGGSAFGPCWRHRRFDQKTGHDRQYSIFCSEHPGSYLQSGLFKDVLV